MIPINYDPAAKCPLFQHFIYRIMGDGPDATEEEKERAARMVAYIQRLCGSAATAKPEKMLVVCWGAVRLRRNPQRLGDYRTSRSFVDAGEAFVFGGMRP